MIKRLIAILLCLSTPSWATWTFIQHPTSVCGSGSCAITVTALGAGNLVVVTGGAGGAGGSMTIPTGGCSGTWTHNASCLSNTIGYRDTWYCLNATGGATTVTLTSASSIDSGTVMEWSTTKGPPIFDTCSNRTQSTNVTTAAGVALTLTGTNDVIVQSGEGTNTMSAISGAYTDFFDASNGNGNAGASNTSVGTAPNWTQTSGMDALIAIAFQETSSTKACVAPFCGILGQN